MLPLRRGGNKLFKKCILCRLVQTLEAGIFKQEEVGSLRLQLSVFCGKTPPNIVWKMIIKAYLELHNLC